MWKKIRKFRQAKAMVKQWVIINDKTMEKLKSMLPPKWYKKIVRLSVFEPRTIVK